MNYWLYTTKDAIDNMAMIVYLHGGSGKGDDLDIIMSNAGYPQYLKEGLLKEVNGYVVIPQVPANQKGWLEIKDAIKELVIYISDTYKTDKNRIALTG